jgi:hypothetical protein
MLWYLGVCFNDLCGYLNASIGNVIIVGFFRVVCASHFKNAQSSFQISCVIKFGLHENNAVSDKFFDSGTYLL